MNSNLFDVCTVTLVYTKHIGKSSATHARFHLSDKREEAQKNLLKDGID